MTPSHGWATSSGDSVKARQLLRAAPGTRQAVRESHLIFCQRLVLLPSPFTYVHVL